ncbi:CpxP family protein [Vibrio japonicus]|uniref:CpxP family protein n=1 Tax=Vibrio japonicus TaxID=1824638 RepID=A0ABY5LFL1_9VIBR|nr:CpxP family protein [Vibrio japonicus]UUM30809.1 CpxP family protein [Vibrio japonicus]
MKTAKKLVLAAVVLPLTLGAASVFAYGGKNHHKGPQDECGLGFERGMMGQLDLTEEQQGKLNEMRKSGKDKWKGDFEAKRAEMQAHRAKVHALILADNFDKAAANELAKEMVEQQTERKVQMMERHHQMLSILTPEQKAKFTELQNERAGQCADRMQKRMNADK